MDTTLESPLKGRRRCTDTIIPYLSGKRTEARNTFLLRSLPIFRVHMEIGFFIPGLIWFILVEREKAYEFGSVECY